MARAVRDRDVTIVAGAIRLPGTLAIPAPVHGIVVFAHGSGSSRLSPRNRYVAEVLQQRGMGTLLFDLLTEFEARDRAKVFDVALLAERLLQATGWVREQFPEIPIGYFGASTGAAAALAAAARAAYPIHAVVSRGGRPDLAMPVLARVTVPTLLIVGALDHPVLEWNEEAQAALGGPSELAVVPGATHLFEEPGTLEEAARVAAAWFVRHLAAREPSLPVAPRQ